MTGFLRKLAELAYRLAPKRNHVVVWGWPDYEDSVIAIERGLTASSVRKVVLLMTDPRTPPSWELGSKTIRVRKNSVRGVFWFCLARYVFFTHPCFTRNFPRNVVSVNIWHGMPIKKIGWLIKDDPGTSCRHTLATSPFWGEIMGRAMRTSGDVLSIGLPRNDRLFLARGAVLEKLGYAHETNLLAWLPTYRKSVRGHSRTDGIPAGNVFEMPGLNPGALNDFLKSRGAVLMVKPHPMAMAGTLEPFSNLLVVDDTWFRNRSLSLYELLGATSLLISDISSVVIDYLLLDRPVIHAFSDFEEYSRGRGFTVEPISSYLAGPVVKNQQELEDAVSTVLSGGDPEAVKRKNLARLSHSHGDDGATRRLLERTGLSS